MSAPEPRVAFPTRPGRVARTALQACGAGLGALACAPLALVGAPLMASVGALLSLALAFSLSRATYRELAGGVPPRLVADADGLALRKLGGRVAQRLPWSWLAGLVVEDGGRRLRVELAGGRRVEDGRPLVLELSDLAPEAREAVQELDGWLRGGRAAGALPEILARHGRTPEVSLSETE